jgi:hypothetical protein
METHVRTERCGVARSEAFVEFPREFIILGFGKTADAGPTSANLVRVRKAESVALT